MLESAFRAELKKSYEAYYGPGCFSISFPSMYIPGGVSDLILCVKGRFIAVECKLVNKLPKRKDTNMLKYGFTPIQSAYAKKVREAGGIALGAICVRPLMITVVTELVVPEFALYETEVHEYKTLLRVGGLWKGDAMPWEGAKSNFNFAD